MYNMYPMKEKKFKETFVGVRITDDINELLVVDAEKYMESNRSQMIRYILGEYYSESAIKNRGRK